MRVGRVGLVLLLLASAAPSGAQEIGARVGKLESEMRAVQRKVFPGGAGQSLEPDITPAETPRGPGPGTPASSPVTDLSQRVSSLETQMASLTGQVEQNGYRIRQLEDQFAAYRRANDARPGAGAPGADSATDTPAPRGTGGGPGPLPRPPGGDDSVTDAPRGGDAATASVERSATGDAAEDGYLYGYRLWQAKRYPEAETALKQVVATYPKSRRASFAQNLLGRSYLDEGKPSLASIAFYDNYKKMPDGERAPDSLYFLAQALMKLNKPADACKVYGELSDVYAARITPEMKANVARGRAAAKCG